MSSKKKEKHSTHNTDLTSTTAAPMKTGWMGLAASASEALGQKSAGDFKATLRRLLDEGNDYIGVACEGFKTSHVNAARAHEKGLETGNNFYTAVVGKPEGRMTELLSGFRAAEWHSPYTLLSRKNAEKFLELNINPADAYELNYLAEKACGRQAWIQLEGKPNTIPAGDALRKKFKTSWKFYTGGGMKAIHKFIFIILSIVLLGAIKLMSMDAGISGDEFTQHNFAKVIVDHWDGKDTAGKALSDPEKLMHLYGCSFDTFCYLSAGWFGVDDIMEWRHLWNSIFGWLAMFFGALILRRLTGGSWKYAWIGLLMLFFTPRLLGESFNNPKDIPFATGYVLALYYTIKVFYHRNIYRISSMLGLVFNIALGISIRIGGLLSIALMGLYAGLQYIRNIGWPQFRRLKWQGFGRFLMLVLGLSVASYILGILPWPYGWDDPFNNPFKALGELSKYQGSLRQLFEGKLYDSDQLPRYYLIKYVWITLPLVSLIGVALLIPGLWKRKLNNEIFFLIFAAIFPVAYIYILKSQVYGGMRHILFVIPCLVILAALGFYLIERLLYAQKWARVAIPALCLGLTALPASFIVRNHPLEYIYFNEVIGGVKGAYGEYEMDYYLASLRPSTEWFLENVARKNPDKKYVVLSYGMDMVKYYARKDKNVKVGFTRYDERSRWAWDYAIFYNGYMDKYRLQSGLYPPTGTVYSPMVDGKPMGVVIQNPGTMASEAYTDMDKKKDFRGAADKYLAYLKLDPQNNEVWSNLGLAYANLGNMDSAILSARQAVTIYPEYTQGLISLAQFYGQIKAFDSAAKTMELYIKARPKDAEGMRNLAQYLAQKGSLSEAATWVNESIQISPFDHNTFKLGAYIYQQLKDPRAEQYNKAGALDSKDAATQSTAAGAAYDIWTSLTGRELEFEKFAKGELK